jgi:hypothetical protein
MNGSKKDIWAGSAKAPFGLTAQRLCLPAHSLAGVGRETLVFFVCGFVFYLGLTTESVHWIGLLVRYDAIFLPLILAGLFYCLARFSHNLSMSAVVLLSASLCSIVLSGVWHGHISDLATLAGFYPHSDGRSYLEGALNLLNGHELGEFASRRPLSVVAWAFLLACGGWNLKVAMALMVFLCAVAIGHLARVVIRNYGWVSGYLVFLALLLFYRRFIGIFLTEHLGLALGCLGCSLLWWSLHRHRKSFLVCGLLLLSLALNVRVGALFVLPALAVWAGWNWEPLRRFSWKGFAVICLTIGLGFGLNALTLQTVGKAGASQGNFSYTLYGLVHGGDWTQVGQDHPELLNLPEVERHQAIYERAFATIISQPSSLLKGAVRAYRDFFFSTNGPYSFVFFALQRSIITYPPDTGMLPPFDFLSISQKAWEQPWKYLQIAAVFGMYILFTLLAVLGWVVLLKRRSVGTWLLVTGWGGILLSVPFIPPWDVDLMRVHAATLPFLLFPPAFGLSFLLSKENKIRVEHVLQQQRTGRQYVGLMLIAGIPLLFFFLPFWFSRQTITLPSKDISCVSGELWNVTIIPGSNLVLGSATTASSAGGNVDTTISTIKKNRGVLFSNNQHRANAFNFFTSGQTLALGYDHLSRSMRYLVVEEEKVIPFNKSGVYVCALPFYDDDKTTWWKVSGVVE